MRCPVCLRPTHTLQESDGNWHDYCPSCGWGRGHEIVESLRRESERASFTARHLWLLLPLYWVLAVAIVVGPFYGVVYGLPQWIDATYSVRKVDAAQLSAKFFPFYWKFMLVYLGLALAFDPPLAGWSWWRRDPAAQFDKMMTTFAILLLPGKLFWYIVKLTVRAALMSFNH